MLEGSEAINLIHEELIKELSGRCRGVTIMIDQGPRETRDFERFDVYLAFPESFIIDRPEEQIEQFEACRGLVNSLSSEISARLARLKGYENIAIAGIGIHKDFEIIESPAEFEALFADIPPGFVSWKLSFFVFFARWPIIEVRGEELDYPSELLIYAPTEIREEYEQKALGKFFPSYNEQLEQEAKEKEGDKDDPFQPDEDLEDDKPSFN